MNGSYLHPRIVALCIVAVCLCIRLPTSTLKADELKSSDQARPAAGTTAAVPLPDISRRYDGPPLTETNATHFKRCSSMAREIAESRLSLQDRLIYVAEADAMGDNIGHSGPKPFTPAMDRVATEAQGIRQAVDAKVRKDGARNLAERTEGAFLILQEMHKGIDLQAVFALTPAQSQALHDYLLTSRDRDVSSAVEEFSLYSMRNANETEAHYMCERNPRIVLKALFGLAEPVKFEK